MRDVLDDEQLTGPQATLVSLRPIRSARLVPPDDIAYLLAAIELNCQVWGGAASPLLPLTDNLRVDDLYRDRLRGAAMDHVAGQQLKYTNLRGRVESPSWPAPSFGDELAFMFLEDAKKDWYRPVAVPVLDAEDPWRPIYAACLGVLPESPSLELLQQARLRDDLKFEEFISVEREYVAGSAADLISRVSDTLSLYPRPASMIQLAYGLVPSMGIRAGGRTGSLPETRLEATDAGPNIVVVCTPGDVGDIALLWNLRTAHGDRYAAPLGVPADQFDPQVIADLLNGRLCRHGIAHKSLYVTSTSLAAETLDDLLPANAYWRQSISIVSPAAVASFGPAPARPRTEVIVWRDGRSTIIPVSAEDRASLPLRGRSWSDLNLKMEIEVIDSPFPHSDDVRADSLNEEFFAGTLTVNAGSGTEGIDVTWPSRLLMLRVHCDSRDLEAAPSEAGTACITFLESLEYGVDDLYFLAHAPLLGLLDKMAQRQGTAWAKAHLRARREVANEELPEIAPSEDDLAEFDFNKFVGAVGSSKAARAWLDWAERRRIVVKGFPIECEKCRAQQWVPVTGFAPPLTCRGCARLINRPFMRETVSFKYRLGESLRRVFENDAVGHLLVTRYFTSLFSHGRTSSLVGAHPGVDLIRRGESTRLGEADVLLLKQDGNCIPIEVKRSFAGVTSSEVAKLDTLVDALNAPWSVLAVPDWAANTTADFRSFMKRDGADIYYRLLLSYEHLLEAHPVWSMGADPFAWSPMTAEEITKREAEFTRSLEQLAQSGSRDWFEEALLYRRGMRS